MSCRRSLASALAPWPLGLLLVLLPARLPAQEPANLSDIAQLLSLEDRREFDGPALRRAAQHPDAFVRARTAMTLGHIGDPSGTPILVDLLADPDTSVRIEAAFSLGQLRDSAAVAELAGQLDRLPQDSAGTFGVEVATALAKIGGPRAEAALGRLLDRHPPAPDGSDPVTAAILQESFRLGARSSLARRLPDYISRAGGEWRRNAAWAASRMRLAGAVPALLEAANDGDPLTRSYVARALTAPIADSAGLARPVFTSALRTLSTDDEGAVRVNALRSLATFADPALSPLAIARLVDRDPNVVVQAATTLGALGGERSVGALADRLATPASDGLRRAVATGLARLDPARALTAAAPWRTDADWRQRALYVDVVAAAGGDSLLARLAPMLADADARVVAATLNAMEQGSHAGDSTVLAAARGRMGHPDIGVRAAAIGIVAREKDPRGIAELVAAYRRAEPDAENDARIAAVDALGDIAEVSDQARAAVERGFLATVSRSPQYLVRREAAARLGEAAVRRSWGGVRPVETGRGPEEYRELARRFVAPGARVPTVTIETDRGTIVLMLYAQDAPATVDNFLRLVDRRYFDNGRWHRVVPNFVAQDGDPRGDGSGGPGTTIRDEINRRRYDRGALGMALSGPDTGGSQFFITHSPQPHLDGGYTVFGHVVSGWNTLDQVVQGDRIRRIFR
jgi:cyclophilin family peptidyl-prolyl cis-trans isomerase/HEAT repeat protein